MSRRRAKTDRVLFTLLVVLLLLGLATVIGYTLAKAVPSDGVIWVVMAGVLLMLALIVSLESRLQDVTQGD